MTWRYSPNATTYARLALWGVVVGLGALAGIAWVLYASDWASGRDRAVEQPIPFSHEHHVGGDGLDCRYCHHGVEDAAFAGIPSTEICMHCHAHLFADAPVLAPVREGFAAGRPISWWRVDDAPDFVYFDHSAHVRKGVGCETCHGRVDRMPRIRKVVSLRMPWCVECHRDPAPRLRPPDAVFEMGWSPTGDRAALASALRDFYDPRPRTSCSECHR